MKTLGDLPLYLVQSGIKVYDADRKRTGIVRFESFSSTWHWEIEWHNDFLEIVKIENYHEILNLELCILNGKIRLPWKCPNPNKDIFVNDIIPKEYCPDCNKICSISGVDRGFCDIHPWGYRDKL